MKKSASKTTRKRISKDHFTNSEINKESYYNLNLSHFAISNSKIKDTTFTNCKFTSVDFVSANFQRCKFINCSFSMCSFEQVGFSTQDFEDCTFLECHFIKTDMQRVSFLNSDIKDCILTENFRLITGEFRGGSIVSTDFTGAYLQNIKFKSKLSSVTFNKIKGKSLSFSNSEFDDRVTFDYAHITRGRFIDAKNIKRTQFYTCRLDDCQFDWLEAFVVMAFGKKPDSTFDNDNYFDECIAPVLKKLDVDVKRVDRYEFEGKITDEILGGIKTSAFVIAELSGATFNVYFETGYSLGANKQIIFCIDNINNIPFDLKDYNFIVHGTNLKQFRKKLTERVKYLLKKREVQPLDDSEE